MVSPANTGVPFPEYACMDPSAVPTKKRGTLRTWKRLVRFIFCLYSVVNTSVAFYPRKLVRLRMQRRAGRGVEGLESDVRKGVSRIRGLELGDEVAVEVLTQLVEGRKTMSEIVEGVYGLTRSDEGFSSSFTKVRRATKRLESSGLVSTGLFGRDKPYRLTDLAMINLARIGGGRGQVRILPRIDILTYAATAALSLPVAFLGLGWVELLDSGVIVVFGCFFYLLGASTVRVVQAFRKVF